MGSWVEVPPEACMYVVVVLLTETMGWADLPFKASYRISRLIHSFEFEQNRGSKPQER
jgi:hypothetical protein